MSIKPSAATASAKPSAAASVAPAAGQPIKVGVIEQLTGTQANGGKDNQDGFSLYLTSINSTVAARKIEPIFADDRIRADVGLTKAKELVESPSQPKRNSRTGDQLNVPATPSLQDCSVPFTSLLHGDCYLALTSVTTR